MTTPLTTPIAVPATGMNVSAAARAVAAKAPANFVELSGADLQALLNFQKALPTSKGRKLLKGEEEEDFATGNGTATDSPEWVMAQAGQGVANVVLDAAPAAAGGGGVAVAPTLSGAAAAATAAPVMTGWVFAPFLALVPGSDDNNRPTLSIPNDTLTLAVNATSSTPTSPPAWNAKDADGNALQFFFQLTAPAKDTDASEANRSGQPFMLDGKRLSSVSQDGRYKIDANGNITRNDSTDSTETEQVTLCEEDTLTVVVTDFGLVSAPVFVTIDRVLPEFAATDDEVDPDAPANNNTLYRASSFDGEVNFISEWNSDHALRNIDIFEIDNSQEFQSLSIHKEGMELHLDYAFGTVDEPDFHSFKVEDHFGVDINDSVSASALDGKIEYIKFAPEASFKGYVLNSDTVDSVESESGVYNLITGIDGTTCKDVLVSSYDSEDSLTGGNGNDLLFSYGDGDALNGGAGNDLIVIDQNSEDTVVVFDAEAIGSGFDTVVNFDYHSQITIGGYTFSFEETEDDKSPVVDKSWSDRIETVKDEEGNSTLSFDGELVAHFVNVDFSNYNVSVLPV